MITAQCGDSKRVAEKTFLRELQLSQGLTGSEGPTSKLTQGDPSADCSLVHLEGRRGVHQKEEWPLGTITALLLKAELKQ